METREYQNIYTNEATHFFYVWTHAVVLSWLARYVIGKKNQERLKVLDAGCGTGLLVKKLGTYGDAVGVDVSSEALKFARRRGAKVIKASIGNLPFAARTFDVITCIDVIYHQRILDDKAAIKEIYRVLKPGGVMILRVPAHRWLHLSHDRYVHTRARYDRGELEEKLRSCGFLIEKLSYVGMILYPFLMCRSVWEKVKPPETLESSITKLPKYVNGALSSLLSLERHVLQRMNLPMGIGLMALCRKPA